MTEVDDLLLNEPNQKKEESPNHGKQDKKSSLDLIDLESKTRKRDIKIIAKDMFPAGIGKMQRRISLDYDYVEKIKSTDLRNILKEK